MKKVLVICDIFPPAFAPRMGYLCKYLPEHGWEPVIITEYSPQDIYKELSDSCPNVTYINYYHSNNTFIRYLKYAFVFFADFFFDYKDRIMTKIAQKLIETHHVSLILSSTYRTFPIRTAYKLSKKKHIPLLIDLRDIVEQFPSNEHISKKFTYSKKINQVIANVLTKKLLRQRNKVLQEANAVTTVSPWHIDVLKHYAKNVYLIYNGFDPELFVPKLSASHTFKITYTGRLMSAELRDPSLLFEAVANLYNAEKISPETLRIQFYTDDESKNIISRLATTYRIISFTDYFGYVSNHSIPDILNDSSVLLLLTNKSTIGISPKGIMTTKVFEYLAVEKPVLCVRSDEGCLAETIRETKSGIAANTVEQVEYFIMEKYAEWQQNGYTHQQTNRQKVKQFSRKEQAEQFVCIFESLVEHHQT